MADLVWSSDEESSSSGNACFLCEGDFSSARPNDGHRMHKVIAPPRDSPRGVCAYYYVPPPPMMLLSAQGSGPSSVIRTPSLRSNENSLVRAATGSTPTYSPNNLFCIPVASAYKNFTSAAQRKLETPKATEEKKRKILRFKTEMCKNYSTSAGCKFGSECHYAHGKEDLRKNTLLDLMNADMIDINHHRVRPCFDWCSTGAW